MNQSTKAECLYHTPATVESALKEPSTSGFVKASDLVRKSSTDTIKVIPSIDTSSASAVTVPKFVSVSKIVPLVCSESQVNSVETMPGSDDALSSCKRESWCKNTCSKRNSLISSPVKTSPQKLSTVAKKNQTLEKAARGSSKITAFFSE